MAGSPYENDVDFASLALQDPAFNKFVKVNGQLDFSNPQAVQQLTKSLLKRDFNMEILLPDDRLCPPVPNRFNYVLWVQSLLDSTSKKFANDTYDAAREVTGLDIGTGASCIYPLLACSRRPRWKFAATDIDDKNLHYAYENISRNKLENRIRTFKTKSDSPLVLLDHIGLHRIDFTMCNPPFYHSPSELLESAKAKSRPPHSACTGAEIEMVTPGGEVAFVSRMIDESMVLKHRVQWYTSMLGKLSSMSEVVERLKSVGVENWAVTEFVQGQKTRRWAVGWSWGTVRPRQEIARNIASLPKNLLPFPCDFRFSTAESNPSQRINAILSGLDIQWQFRQNISMGIGYAKSNVWSRAARRKKVHEEESKDSSDEDSQEPGLGFKLQIRATDMRYDVHIRWLQGKDSVLFESFCGMVKRQVTS